MIWTIAKREFLEKILDFRVIASFVIAIVLTIVATLVAGGDYQSGKTEYDKQVSQAQSLLNSVKVYSQYKPAVFFPPSPLSVFSQGIGLPTPIKANIDIDDVPKFSPRLSSSNPMMSVYDALDIVTVVRVLFSLLVILLTFDSFSGEKERGTLRLAFSNPVARINLLYGKFAGTVMIIGVVVCLTYLIATIMIRVSSGMPLIQGYHERVLLMIAATALYLSLFAAVGILASIRFHHSSTSLAVLLFVWFFLAILQPNLNTFIASESESKKSLQNVQQAINDDCGFMKELEQLQKDRGSIFEDRSKRKYYSGPSTHMVNSMGGVMIHPIITDADYDVLDYCMQQVRILRKSADCAETNFDGYKQRYLSRLDKQLEWKRTLDLFSPAALFLHSTAILSRTDIDNIDDFFERARQYRHDILTYLDQKGVYSINAQLYFSRLSKDDIDRTATEQRLTRYKEDPNSVPYINDQPPLDLRDTPIFTMRESSTATDSGRSAVTLLPLFFYLFLVFFIAGKSMQSYDPR